MADCAQTRNISFERARLLTLLSDTLNGAAIGIWLYDVGPEIALSYLYIFGSTFLMLVLRAYPSVLA